MVLVVVAVVAVAEITLQVGVVDPNVVNYSYYNRNNDDEEPKSILFRRTCGVCCRGLIEKFFNYACAVADRIFPLWPTLARKCQSRSGVSFWKYARRHASTSQV